MKWAKDCSRLTHAWVATTVKRAKPGLSGNPELQANLQEVIAMLLEDGEPSLESDFVGLQQICVPA